MQEDPQQLSFDGLWKESKLVAKPTPAKAEKKTQSQSKRVRKPSVKPIFEVRLIHEQGVDWRLDCLQVDKEELEPAYYDHLACEAIKLELLRMLKQDAPVKMEVYMMSLVLCSLGIDVPTYLRIDANKNLLEHDFWGSFDRIDHKRFSHQSSAFLWAFYFTDFTPNQRVGQRSFTEYPAEETDISFLIDFELAVAKFPGLKQFESGLS